MRSHMYVLIRIVVQDRINRVGQCFFGDILHGAKAHTELFIGNVLQVRGLIAEKGDPDHGNAKVDRLVDTHQAAMRDKRFRVLVL